VGSKKLFSNRKLAELIIEAMNKRELSLLDEYLCENAVFDFPGPGIIKGKKRILIFLKVLFRKYPQLEFKIEDTIVEEKRACVIWSNKGKSSKGESYANRGITLVHFKDGKITYISDYFKDTSFVNTS